MYMYIAVGLSAFAFNRHSDKRSAVAALH